MTPAPKTFTFRLVGTTFVDNYPATLDRTIDALADGWVRAEFQRVYDNEHDPNAVAVCVAGGRIGWVPRHLAARIAPALDAGRTYVARVVECVTHPDHPQNPGITVRASIREVDCATGEPA